MTMATFLKNCLLRLFKLKYVIFLICAAIIIALGAWGYNYFVRSKLITMTIELNYPGSEKGLNPDGSFFDITEFKSDFLIEKAKKGLQIEENDNEFLKTRLTFTTNVPNDVFDTVVESVENSETNVFLPTTYFLYYSQKDKFSKNETSAFMNNLAGAYTEYFNDKYTLKNDLLSFDENTYDLKKADYLEAYDLLYKKTTSMISLIESHEAKDNTFKSSEGYNLGMICDMLRQFKDINLANYNSFVVQNGVSRNNSLFVGRTERLIEDKTLDYNILAEEANVKKDALSDYDGNITANAFIPAVNEERDYYMARTKTGLDYVAEEAQSAQVRAAVLRAEVEELKNYNEKFSSHAFSAKENTKKADSMLENLTERLTELSSYAKKTDDEYLEHETRDYFKFKVYETSEIGVSFIIKITLLGILILCVLIITYDFFAEDRQKKFRQRERNAIEKAKKNLQV